MSSFESNFSVKKRRKSGQVATKTKAKQAAARATNTTVITATQISATSK
jgi:hypothetical protein